MTKGEGLVGFLYAIKDLLNTFAIMIVTGVAFLAFFYLIVKVIWQKANPGGSLWGGGGGNKVDSKQIMYAIFILFVILSVYSLIALTASIFGVNSSPSGGLLVQ